MDSGRLPGFGLSRSSAITWIGAALALAVLGGSSSTLSRGVSASGAEKGTPMIRDPDYVGRVVGDPRARVLLALRRDERGRQQVRLQVRDMKDVCESKPRRLPAVTYRLAVQNDRRFRGISLVEPELSVRQLTFTLVAGRLLDEGLARGVIFELREPLDEPAGTGNADECWSDGLVEWKAHKVSDGSGGSAKRRSMASGRFLRADSVQAGRYEGRVVQLPPGKGTLDLTVRGQVERAQVDLETQVRVECDGPDRIEKLGPFRVPLSSDGRFERALFTQHRRSKHRFFTYIRGRVFPNGQAEGAFFHFDDPWDPPGTVNVAECGTPFKYVWTAQRVR